MRQQVLSYGGGIQTIAMIVLALKNKLPWPDMIVMANTGREKTSTFDYMEEIVKPHINVEIAPHSLATCDLYASNGDILIPAYTVKGKLPTFCSGEWKERVIQRYLRNRGIEQCDCWIGYSQDESDRVRRNENLKWYQRRYPLLELGLNRADCKFIIKDFGWPLPSKSACWMCPNQDDDSWLEMKTNYPDDFQKAIELEQEINEDDQLWLHESRVPLSQAVFNPNRKRVKAGAYQCSFGCFV